MVAYDAVAVLVELGKENPTSLEERMLDARGFSGFNGRFVFYADGRNKHNLKIFEVTAKGPKETFFEASEITDGEMGFYAQTLPEIYGKESSEVLRFLQSNY